MLASIIWQSVSGSARESRIGAVVFGSLVLVVIALFHGIGLQSIVNLYKRKSQVYAQSPLHPIVAQCFFGLTILLMLVLHLGDMSIWAIVLAVAKLVPDIYPAFSLSSNAYTTLGNGNVNLAAGWQSLSPIMAVSGLFTFAWTTGQLMNLLTVHYDVVEEMTLNYRKRKELRRTERAQVKLVRTEEYEKEKARVVQEREQESGLPFAEKRELRKAQEQKLRQLREGAKAEIEALRRQGDEQEKKLGQQPASGKDKE